MCEASKNLSLTLLGEIFTAYREKVLAGCPEGFDLKAEVGVGGEIVITYVRDKIWLRIHDMDNTTAVLIECLGDRLRSLGWKVWFTRLPIK